MRHGPIGFVTPVEDGLLPLVDRGVDADLTPEEAAEYAFEAEEYELVGPPPEVVEAFKARKRGRPAVGDHAEGPSPRIGVRLSPVTRLAVRDAAKAEGMSEAEWLRAAIDDRLKRRPLRKSRRTIPGTPSAVIRGAKRVGLRTAKTAAKAKQHQHH